MTRAALYARVSTREQTLETQVRELAAYAESLGWQSEVFRETISGAAPQRPVFDGIIARAHAGEFDVLVVWAFDRFSRAVRIDEAIGEVLDLEESGVRFVALHDQEISTPEDASRAQWRELLIALRAWGAKWERLRRRERIQARMDDIKSGRSATRSGRPPGRPRRVTPQLLERILALRSTTPKTPWARVAQLCQVPAASARKWASSISSPSTTSRLSEDASKE